MNVRDLITALERLDPKLPVICYCETGVQRDTPAIFEIEKVSALKAERVRDAEGVACLRWTAHAEDQAIIELVSDI